MNLWTSHFVGITKSICEKICEIKEGIVKVASRSVKPVNVEAHPRGDAAGLFRASQLRRAVIFFVLADAKG